MNTLSKVSPGRIGLCLGLALLLGFMAACKKKDVEPTSVISEGPPPAPKTDTAPPQESVAPKEATRALKVSSGAFEEGQDIPKQYTADGQNVSPPIAWADAPAATKSLALIADDPDAPGGTWVHWVIYRLPPEARELSENVPASPELPSGARQGKNSFGSIGYGGPEPPPGPAHRYFFKVYALDLMPEIETGATKEELLKAIEGHVLAEGQLMGKYGR